MRFLRVPLTSDLLDLRDKSVFKSPTVKRHHPSRGHCSVGLSIWRCDTLSVTYQIAFTDRFVVEIWFIKIVTKILSPYVYYELKSHGRHLNGFSSKNIQSIVLLGASRGPSMPQELKAYLIFESRRPKQNMIILWIFCWYTRSSNKSLAIQRNWMMKYFWDIS